MTPEDLIQEYLSALEKSDIKKISQLFKEDAIVLVST
jgi:ketosteroid isomerase-like protein